MAVALLAQRQGRVGRGAGGAGTPLGLAGGVVADLPVGANSVQAPIGRPSAGRNPAQSPQGFQGSSGSAPPYPPGCRYYYC